MYYAITQDYVLEIVSCQFTESPIYSFLTSMLVYSSITLLLVIYIFPRIFATIKSVAKNILCLLCAYIDNSSGLRGQWFSGIDNKKWTCW